MSVIHKSSLQDYWSSCPIIHTPYAASVGMSRDRFFAILTMFHLNNNDAKAARGQPGYNPLFKIQPVIDTLIKFQDVYTPEEQLTTNEAICPFQGHIFFRVCIKGKPHKYGIKIFELCEAKSGYVYNLDVYTGAHPTNSEHNTAFSVVDRLCDKTKGKGHCVYMDRWFSSPKIFDHLWGCKTKAVGTVMSNRKETPKQAFSEKRWKNITPTGSPLGHQVERHSWCLFPDHCPWRYTCCGTIVKGGTSENETICSVGLQQV